MFTGIITDIGVIIDIEQRGDMYVRISTHYDISTFNIGSSIACNGICLTVIAKGKIDNTTWFDVEISAETISKTAITHGRRAWEKGTKLNLERALKVGDELGGHIVSGHVDGIVTITEINKIGDSVVVTFAVPEGLSAFITQKGSVTLDGTSLTLNDVNNDSFTINIIPHTQEYTIWNDIEVGDKINLEIDTLARYVARLVDVRGI